MLLDVYQSGDRLKTVVFHKRDDFDGANKFYKEWGELLVDVYLANPHELGLAKLVDMKVENTDLVIPLPDDWDEKNPTAGIYILLAAQLKKLNLVIQNLCNRR
jgi:hypothetical protein